VTVEIITRKQWGAPIRPMLWDRSPKDNRVIVHTEAGAVRQPGDLGADCSHMRSIDSFHANVRGWKGGVGYQFVIMESGRIMEGRGFDYEGGHTVGLNTELGICFSGHGDKAPATAAQWASAKWLIGEAIRLGFLKLGYVVSGHRDHIKPGSKSCPGNLIYPHIQQLAGIVGHDQEDDDMAYEAWSDEDKAAFWKDAEEKLAQRLLYALTGSQPANAQVGPWTNLGDVVNASEANTAEVLEAVASGTKEVKGGTLVALIQVRNSLVDLIVEIAGKLGVQEKDLKKVPRSQ
jgi:N-acetylmuramoyl-L-alanine amidase